ncbi:hypothetical protein BX616_001467 [Lobosporangium transversale]|nr:hypothetical protein BX616_001467 [Lobosporangium transversale]
MAMRDFWDVMRARLDLSWLDLWTITTPTSSIEWRKNCVQSTIDDNDDVDTSEKIKSNKVITKKFGMSPTSNEAPKGGFDKDSVNSTEFCETVDMETAATDVLNEEADNDADDVEGYKDKEEKEGAFDSNNDNDNDKDGEKILNSRIAKLRQSHHTMDTKQTRHKTVIQHPSPSQLLKGLWEEEERNRRQLQMIPEFVHKPQRSKVLNRKPILKKNIIISQGTTDNAAWIRPKVVQEAPPSSSTTLEPSSSVSSENTDQTMTGSESQTEVDNAVTGSSSGSSSSSPSSAANNSQYSDQEIMLRKKHGVAVAARSNALSEGYDLNEYKPWRDGTVEPDRGDIGQLCRMRRTVMEPWPLEESRAKVECARMLHRMREQLNVVINLQIHLRSMIKTTPSHMSFLLSIRHPGQVSVELLNALYGPQFLQTSAFRAIEQLLWGKNPSPQIEYQERYHQHQHEQQYQKRSEESSSSEQHDHPPSYEYTHSQTPEYRYRDQDQESYDESNAMEDHSDVYDYHHRPQGYSRRQNCHHDQDRDQRQHHHYGHGDPTIDKDIECEFEEEFDEQSYQDPMLMEIGRISSMTEAKGHQNNDHPYERDQDQDQHRDKDIGTSMVDGGARNGHLLYAQLQQQTEVIHEETESSSKTESEIETLGVAPSKRRDSGMVIDLDQDLAF